MLYRRTFIPGALRLGNTIYLTLFSVLRVIHEILSASQPSPLPSDKIEEIKLGVLGIPLVLNILGNDRQMPPSSEMISGLIRQLSEQSKNVLTCVHVHTNKSQNYTSCISTDMLHARICVSLFLDLIYTSEKYFAKKQ